MCLVRVDWRSTTMECGVPFVTTMAGHQLMHKECAVLWLAGMRLQLLLDQLQCEGVGCMV